MAIDLVIPVSDVDSIIGTASNQYDSIRLYRASTRGGTYSLLTTITLVAGDTVYTYTDTTGATSSWYKVSFYNSATLGETSLAESEPFPATRALFTLKEIRQKIIHNLGGEYFDITSLTTTTVTVSLLKDTARDTDWFKGWHMYRPAAVSSVDYDRRVSAYDETTGVLTHGGTNYSDTTATSEYVELVPVDIDLVTFNEKIGDGLQRCRYLYRYEFGTTSGQLQYVLPNFVEGEEYVAEKWLRFGDTADQYRWEIFDTRGRWSKIRGSNYQCMMDIQPARSDNEVIALEVWRPGEVLEGEDDFTTVHPKWVEAAVMVEVLGFLVDRDMLRHGRSNLTSLLQKWSGELVRRARHYGPTPMMKVQLPEPIKSFPEV